MKFFDTNCKFLRKSKGFSQAEMAAQLSVSRTTWTGYEKKASQPNLSGLYKIAEYFNLSIAQLLEVDLKRNVHLNKKDKDLKKQENVLPNVLPNVLLKAQKADYKQEIKITVVAEPDALYDKKNRTIPITDLSVAAGSGIYAKDYIENVSAIRLPVAFLKKNATYLTVRIKGDSMAPTLQDSGYAIIRLLDKSEWAKMPDERIYAIGDVDGKVYLKRVKNRFKQDFIVLMSDNPDKASNPNFNLITVEINTIWYMEWYFSAKMPNIHDQYYQKVERLEEQMDIIMKQLGKITPK